VSASQGNSAGASPGELRAAFEKFMENYASSAGRVSLSTGEREQLFATFMKLLDSKGAMQSAH